MGPFRLGKLWLKNYRSFEAECIEFKPEGMTLVRGFNRDTGGSSYAGKSSVPVAIAMALGFCPFSIKDQQTWGTKGAMSVSLELITDQGTWTVTRGSKTTLKPPAGETITGVAAVDAKLREIVGTDPEILAALTYRKQGERGLFLTKADAAKKEFLTLVLGLGAFEEAGDIASKAAAAARARLAAAQAGLVRVETQVRSISTAEPVIVDTTPFEASVTLLLKSDTDLTQYIIDAEHKISVLEADCKVRLAEVDARFDDKVRAAAQELALVRAVALTEPAVDKVVSDPKLIAGLDEAKKRLARRIEADDELRKGFDVQVRSIDTEIFGLQSRINESGRLKTEIAELDKKIAAAEALKCPTCDQQWLKAKEQLDAWVARLLECHGSLTLAELAVKEIAEKRVERASMVFKPDSKIEQFRAIVTQLTSDVQASRLASENAVKQVQAAAAVRIAEKGTALAELQAERSKQIIAAREDIDRQVRELRDYERVMRLKLATNATALQETQWKLKSTIVENQQRQREFEQRQEQLADLGDELTEAKGAVDLEQYALDSELDFEEFIGYKGFLGVIFDEILAEITEEANAILASVANTSHVTIYFASEAIAQKTGVARKEIRPIISIGGYTAPLESGASGGMITSIDLAVDLAVATVVSKRTNSWPGWMILDESFNGMDGVTKETCMEMLKRYSENRLILIVDHASETKELFNNFIDVEFKNGRSTFMEQKK